ncbi:MAG: DegT/DnrJ/EryC1/StrS family aminotransferase [Oscillospiraceae bacterium]|nr:DegT/DnrJ/EryC1/StrS family aminotransferase [Oscillospiraceae bacterium]
MTAPIHDFIVKYAGSDFERCHTPGHKGFFNHFDITEISGAIDIIKESERNSAGLFGAGRTLFSCSGSTLAIFSMLSFCANKRVTAIRGTHRSFIDAAILLGFDIDWISPDSSVEETVTLDTAAVFVTSIDYYGKMCDIQTTAEICEKLKLPLLADNAHGAYLVFTDAHPIRSGASMSADSAHKTLPALTGAAYLHIAERFTGKFTKPANDAMNLFGTSSPSYLILDSLDLCNLHIANEKERAETAFSAVLHLKENLIKIGYSLCKSDLLRITIDANAYGYSGADCAGELRQRGIICEMYDARYVILMFSTITSSENTEKVFNAMRDIPQKQEIPPVITGGNHPLDVCMSPSEAYFSPKQSVPVLEAVGEICAGVHVIVPPCAPPVIPGETVSEEIAWLLETSGVHQIDIISV